VEWFGVVGVIATLAGLFFTWRKASDADNSASSAKIAAEAAGAAVERTQRQLRANQMLVLIPQLRWISQELDAAIASDSRDLVRRHLDSWRWQAGHVNGLLSEESPSPRKILRSLQDSVALATEATTTLLKEGKPVLDSCELARDAIGTACNLLTVFVGQSASQVPTMTEQEITK
jgi:hypothetical protein